MSESRDRAPVSGAARKDFPSVPTVRAAVMPTAPVQTDAEPEPQWGEAYLLFDGGYLSLDDLLRASND